jgi:hypothetical protein
MWRVSNNVTNGGLNDQIYSYDACSVAGETNASLWNERNKTLPDDPNCFFNVYPGATATTNKFVWRASFRSVTDAPQPGLAVSLSAAAKMFDSRNTFLRIVDNGATGFNLIFSDRPVNFSSVPVTVATGLSYSAWHTVQTEVEYIDGVTQVGGTTFANDIVQLYLNGALIHTGTSWENNWRLRDNGAGYPPKGTRAANSLMFTLTAGDVPAGAPARAKAGEGFYFKNVIVANGL